MSEPEATADLFAVVQSSYTKLRPKTTRPITREDRLVEDLELDSLDLIDVMSVLDEEFGSQVIDALVERAAELQTVGDMIDALHELRTSA